MLSMIVLVRADTRRIPRHISIPLSAGIARSTIATSGWAFSASWSPSWPSAASPTIWNPDRSRTALTPWRTSVWSSMSRTVVATSALQWDRGVDHGAVSGRGVDRELTAERFEALTHADETQPRRAHLGRYHIKPD